jgi:2-alkyl-3-oxoalkanoate reductase
MRIFVAGATGAIGRRLIPILVSSGHAVVGSTRSVGRLCLIRKLGAEAVVANGLDRDAVRAAAILAAPDVIVHEMTDLRSLDFRAFNRSFAASNRLRTKGTDNLMAAARDLGVSKVIAQSFCGWPYKRVGSPVKSETDPLDDEAPAELSPSLDALRYLERVVTTSREPAGIVLRYGAFYGWDTGVLDGHFVDQVRRRRVPLIGDGEGWWSFVHVDDAAAATAAAIERGTAGAIYNIVDDEPARVADWLPELAQLLEAKPPYHVPAWMLRLLGDEHLVTMMTEARAGSNEKAKRELDWRPAHPSWRRGFAEIAARALSHAQHAA